MCMGKYYVYNLYKILIIKNMKKNFVDFEEMWHLLFYLRGKRKYFLLNIILSI